MADRKTSRAKAAPPGTTKRAADRQEAGPRRIRPRRAEPWNIGSVIPWGVAATLGDPLLVVLPVLAATLWILAALGIGAPSAPEVLVPVWSLPPFDAFQDAGTVQLVAHAPWVIWLGRAAFLVARTVVFGTVAALVLQRVRDHAPDLRVAVRTMAARFRTLLVLELAAWAVFGIPLLLGQGSLTDAGRPISELGAMVGQILLINAFFAALDGDSAGAAVRRGFAWLTKRPLGHLGVAVVATAVSNAAYWVARAGELGSPRALPEAAFAAVHAVLITAMLVAFGRRYRLLYAPDIPASGR